MAIVYSGVEVEFREVLLSNKPKSMLDYSPKGTVPVLVLPGSTVIDESRDIMFWALSINDPEQWLPGEDGLKIVGELIDENDASFKAALDKYKYHVRHPEHDATFYRAQGEVFLQKLNDRLSAKRYLLGEKLSVADAAVFPFVRQFAHVDREWFYQTPYLKLQLWLDELLGSALFGDVMQKHALWVDEEQCNN